MFLRLAIIIGLFVSTACPASATPCKAGSKAESATSCCSHSAPQKQPEKKVVGSCCAAKAKAQPAPARCCGAKAKAAARPAPAKKAHATSRCHMCPCCTQGKHQEPLPPVSKPQQRISDTLIQVGSQFTLTIPVDAEDDARAAIVDAHAPFSSHNQRQAAIEVWRD